MLGPPHKRQFPVNIVVGEGDHQAANILQLPDQITAQVDDVGVDVPVRAGAGDLLLQSPDEGELGIGQPLLGVAGAEVIDPIAQFPRLDHLLGQQVSGLGITKTGIDVSNDWNNVCFKVVDLLDDDQDFTKVFWAIVDRFFTPSEEDEQADKNG